MTTYFMSAAELHGLLADRGAGKTFAPARTKRLAWMDLADPESSLAALGEPRASQSPKGFYLSAEESLGRYGLKGAAAAVEAGPEPLVLVGVRACELRAREYLDKVMLEGPFEDALYRRRREATTVVSCDCADCTETCFCTSVGGQPFATHGFDANLTALGEGFLVDVASEAGRKWVGPDRLSALAQATAEQLTRRTEQRQKMVERLRQQNAEFELDASDRRAPALPNDADEAWQRFAADCVECGACTNICPTCHCFYLYDQSAGAEEFERVRTWDSCLLATYHRMAGGVGMKLTPRPRLCSRLANRVLHKFAYSPEQYGLLGCVGCGRCVDACLGAIDIRQVVKELGK